MESPLNLLKLELQNENPVVRVNAIHRLPIVVYAYDKPSEHKKEILKFLDSFVKNTNHDEVLFGLAKKLGELAHFFKLDMQKLLEKLLVCEETVVRQAAIDSYITMAEQLNEAQISSEIIPAILKIKAIKKFPPKDSALNVMSRLFPMINKKERQSLLGKIIGMISEDSLILRRNLARNMGKLAKHVKKETLLHGFISQFKNLALDDSDSVRIICIESLVDLAKVLNDEENKSYLIPIIIQLTGDKSWKVKLNLAKNFADLAEALGKDISENSLFSIFSTLLRDLENEVRVVAVKSLKKFVKFVSVEKLMGILAYLQTLSKDTVPLVRTGVCEVLKAIFETNKKKFNVEIVNTRIQPIIVDLINDTDLEVKIEAIGLLRPWGFYAKDNLMELLKNGVIRINLENPNWRIRYESIKALMELAIDFQKESYFEHFQRFFLQALNDRAFKVRMFVLSQIKPFRDFLSEKCLSQLLKKVLAIIFDDKIFYSYRLTSIFALDEFFYCFKEDKASREKVISSLMQLCDDKLPNIRQTVLKVIIKIFKSKRGQDYNDIIYKMMENKKEDPDQEVRYIVNNFLSSI